MKQSRFSRRSYSVGVSSILAVAAIGLSATPALAAQHAGQQPTLSGSVSVQPSAISGFAPGGFRTRPDPRMG
jgi:hypothetical protein